MKRTELFVVGDYLTDDFRRGETWKIVEIREDRNGMVLEKNWDAEGKVSKFLSNADPTFYMKISNVNSEYTKQKGEEI